MLIQAKAKADHTQSTRDYERQTLKMLLACWAWWGVGLAIIVAVL